MSKYAVVFLIVLSSFETCRSFHCVSSRNQMIVGPRHVSFRLNAVIDQDDGDKGNDNINKKNSDGLIPFEEQSADYSGSVDWDAEWKKVVRDKEKLSSKNRPGKDFYKSEAEIAAIRAANKATEEAARLAAQVPSLPSWDTLKGDWRFWIGILAFLSIGSSLLTTASMQSTLLPDNADPSSYYI